MTPRGIVQHFIGKAQHVVGRDGFYCLKHRLQSLHPVVQQKALAETCHHTASRILRQGHMAYDLLLDVVQLTHP